MVNDFCPAPKGMLGIPLPDAPAITYYALARPGFINQGTTEAMRRLIVETAVHAGRL